MGSRLLRLAAASLAGPASLAGCGEPTAVSGGVGQLSIATAALVLPPGDTARLALVLERGAETYRLPATSAYGWPAGLDVAWATSDPNVVAIDQSGRLSARAAGRAVVRATASAARDSVTVVVRPPDAPALAAVGVAVGDFHTCALVGSGVACWGLRTAALGTGTIRDQQAVAAPVGVVGAESFTSLSAGGDNTCALTAAGAAYCWGRNDSGQVGDGSTDARPRPTPVGGASRYASVSVGSRHVCGLTLRGDVECWGRNDVGQVGVANAEAAVRSPTRVPLPEPVASVTAGAGHTCARTGAGRVYCWGLNDFGQLGRGAPSGSASPGLVSGGLAFTDVSAGNVHTCGVVADGRAYCWGNNFSGRLGTGDLVGRSEPAPIAGGITFGSVSAGGEHTCGLTPAGDAYCWGSNFRGQLGDGLDLGGPLRLDQRDRPVPTPVATGLRFAQVTAGGEAHTCGRTRASAVLCWGSNEVGQLGLGRLTFAPGTALAARSTPSAVVSPP